MRVLIAALAVCLTIQPSMAEPLSPGHPAGVNQARLSSSQQTWMIGIGAVIMIGVGIAVSGGAIAAPNTILQIPSNAVPVSPIATTGTTG
jgi:hypothetical protein